MSNQSKTRSRHLGFTQDELAVSPYARFYNPELAPLPEHVREALLIGAQASELFPPVGFFVASRFWRSKNAVKFYNGRDTAEPWNKEGKYAVKRTKLSCRTLKDNQARLGGRDVL